MHYTKTEEYKNYKRDLEIYKKRKDFFSIAYSVFKKNNVFLYGKAGTGKTQLSKMIYYYLKYAFLEGDEKFNMYMLTINQWTSPIDIIGGETPNGYREGELEKAWKYGGLLILDELPKIEPNTAGILNMALSQTKIPKSTIVNGRGEVLQKNDNFFIIATGNTDMRNTSYKYGGNYKQDFSLIDRFSGSFFLVEKDAQFEMLLLRKYFQHDYDLFYHFMDILRDVVEENEINQIISIRTIIHIVSFFDYYFKRIKSKYDVSKVYDPKMYIQSYFMSSYTKEEYEIIKNEYDKKANTNDVFINKIHEISTKYDLQRNNKSIFEFYIDNINIYKIINEKTIITPFLSITIEEEENKEQKNESNKNFYDF